MERGSRTQTDRAVKDGRAILFGACRKNISKAAKERRRRSRRINMVKPGDGERAQGDPFFSERTYKDSLTRVKGGPLFIGGGEDRHKVCRRAVEIIIGVNSWVEDTSLGIAAMDDEGGELVYHNQKVCVRGGLVTIVRGAK